MTSMESYSTKYESIILRFNNDAALAIISIQDDKLFPTNIIEDITF